MAWSDKYVTQASAGGTGTSGDPWNYANGVITANVGTLDRINVQSDGVYTPGATARTGVGATGAWCWWRGHNSTIGDLAYARLNNGHGLLDTTGYPEIAATGFQSVTGTSGSKFQLWDYFNFTGTVAGNLVGDLSADTTVYRNCSFNNASTNAAARAFNWDDGGLFINCDFRSDGAAGLVFNADSRIQFHNCRFHTADTGASTLVQVNALAAVFNHCLFTAAGSAATVGINLDALSVPAVSVTNCTFYNLLAAIRTPNSASSIAALPQIRNCVVSDCTTFIDDQYVAVPWQFSEENCFLYNVTNPYTNSADTMELNRQTGSGTAGAIFEDTTDCILKSTSTGYGTGWPFNGDIGWARHADPAGGGGGGLLTHPGMGGGMRG